MSIDFRQPISMKSPSWPRRFLRRTPRRARCVPRRCAEYIGQEKAKQNLSDLYRGGAAAHGVAGSRAAPRPSGPGQDHPGGRSSPRRWASNIRDHLRPRHRKARRSGGAADQPERRRHPVCRRDPPAEPGGGGDFVPGHGGLCHRHHHRQGALAPTPSGWICRKFTLIGATTRAGQLSVAAAGPLRRHAAAGAVYRRRSWR